MVKASFLFFCLLGGYFGKNSLEVVWACSKKTIKCAGEDNSLNDDVESHQTWQLIEQNSIKWFM